MSTPVVMPQMGESIAEGTIVRWIKKVGDSVDRDEPLFEISTDKVDAEIPSPAAGVLTAIQVKEGETVPVNSVVATIGTAGEVHRVHRVHKVRRVRKVQVRRRKSEKADATGTPGATVAAPASPDTEDSPAPSPPPTGRGDSGGRSSRRSAPKAAKADHSCRQLRLATEVFAARPQDREGTQRRHLPDQRIRHRRSRHQAGHPWLHRQWRRGVLRLAVRSRATGSLAQDGTLVPAKPAPVHAGRGRSSRPHVASCARRSPSTWS